MTADARTPVQRPLFLIGMPRSGTTLIARGIARHPHVGWFSNYVDRCPACPRLAGLNGLAAFALPRRFPFLPAALRPRISEAYGVWRRCCGGAFLHSYLHGAAATAEAHERALASVQAILRHQCRPRFFAKFTGPPRIGYLRSIFPDAIFVHVLRDPRAVVASLLTAPFWRHAGGTDQPWWQPSPEPDEDAAALARHGRSPAALAAVQWARVVKTTWAEQYGLPPGDFLEIRYEDMVAAPEDGLAAIFCHAELTPNDGVCRQWNEDEKVRDLNTRMGGRLSGRDLEVIASIAGQTAARAGYHLERGT